MFLVCAVIAVLIGTVHSQCTRLLTKDEIRTSVQSFVNLYSSFVESAGTVKDLVVHHFTCIVPTQRPGEIQFVSIAVIFDFTTDMGVTITRRRQIQLQCSGVNNWKIWGFEENPPAVAFNLTTREDCLLCDVRSLYTNVRFDTDANCGSESLSDLILCIYMYLAILFSCVQCVPAGVAN